MPVPMVPKRGRRPQEGVAGGGNLFLIVVNGPKRRVSRSPSAAVEVQEESTGRKSI